MLDLGWAEMLVILVVALIVIGPKDLPKVARTVGRWMGKARAMAREFQSSLEELAREAELDDIKKQIDKAGRADIGKSIEKAVDPKGELREALDVEDRGRRAAAGKRAKLAKPAEPEAGDEPAGNGAEAPAAAEAPPPERRAVAADGEKVAPGPGR